VLAQRTRGRCGTRGRSYAAVTVLSLFVLRACGRSPSASSSTGPTASPSEPVYYVDGARPSPGLNVGPALSDAEYQKGCVPWSAQRPDVYICGPIPATFRPPPPPGDYADYPDVCEAAAAIVTAQAEELALSYDLFGVPAVDVKTCGAGGLGSEQAGTWVAKFGLVNLQDVTPYMSVVVRNFSVDGTSKGEVQVMLSRDPWPSE
jgi:hypothetical protein